jgi:hypothetical protein
MNPAFAIDVDDSYDMLLSDINAAPRLVKISENIIRRRPVHGLVKGKTGGVLSNERTKFN